LAAGGDPSNVPNLAFYKGNHLAFTVREAEDNDFSNDIVNWQEVPAQYLYPIFPVRGSRGCPYKCRYCNFVTHRRFSIKPREILAAELEALSATQRVKVVRFTDDNLFLNRKNLEAFCETIIKARGHMKWTSFIRANSITRDNISLLKESGCLLAQIGMESGDATMLARMNKKEDPDDYLKAVDLLNTHGIFSQLYFIIGFPGETEETINNTVRLINQFKHDGPAANFIMVFPFVLAPLSPIYDPESRAEFGLKGYMSEWQHSTMTSKEARMHARNLLLSIDHIYPFYGIEELAVLDAAMLKRLSHLRLLLRKAEMSNAPPAAIDRLWDELRVVVTGTSNAC
jgi:anaerobic magnesium-protoporphyrin IX monomethyl ester cyclase